jgi:hypothetical protein
MPASIMTAIAMPAQVFSVATECAVAFLNEQRAKVVPGRVDEPVDTTWYLHNGVSNHMTGDQNVFTELDKAITGNVRFGDGLVVRIKGPGRSLSTSKVARSTCSRTCTSSRG